MKEQNRYLRKNVYIDGNTVRKEMVDLPVQQPFSEHKKQINRRMAADHRAYGMSPVFALGIIVAVAIIMVLCVDYIQLQADIKVRLNNINSMEDELAALISENKVLENQVSSYIDLDYVYDVATTELGMRYPVNGQIVYYEGTDSEYVRQYGSISGVGSN